MKMTLVIKTHSGTTIVHVLQDICENCSHYGCLVIVNVFVKMKKFEYLHRHNKNLQIY